MANQKQNFLNLPKKLLFVAVFLMSAVIFVHTPKAQAAACSSPSTNLGTVTSTTSVPTTGSYRIWSRIMSGTTVSDNSYDLEIDGTNCYHVGNLSSMPTGSWQWVDYKDGSTSSKLDLALSAGSHTVKMIGTEDGVKLDRIIMTSDTSCIPNGTGDNCAQASDTTNPIASISAPTPNSKVKGTVTVNASASDDSGTVSKVELYVDGTMVGTADTTAPYSFSWNTTSLTNGTHSLIVKAYDPSNNVGISVTVSVFVDNSPPTVALTSPVNGTTVNGTVNITATASDNVGVTSVDFYRGSSLLASDTTAPYNYSWNTAGVANGNYVLTAKANDAAGNTTTSTAVTVNLNNSSSNPGDVNGDGHVTVIDLSILLTHYGSTSATRAQGDLDGNGSVNVLDLSRLLSNYGT